MKDEDTWAEYCGKIDSLLKAQVGERRKTHLDSDWQDQYAACWHVTLFHEEWTIRKLSEAGRQYQRGYFIYLYPVGEREEIPGI